MENTRKTFEISYPVKALAAVALFASIIILSCTRSTVAPIAKAAADAPEAVVERAVPPGLTAQQIANMQHARNVELKSRNDRNITDWALRVKNNMMRGEGVVIESRLDIDLDQQGRVIGKFTGTAANNLGNVNASDTKRSQGATTEFERGLIHRTRTFTIISNNGRVWKEDDGWEMR